MTNRLFFTFVCALSLVLFTACDTSKGAQESSKPTVPTVLEDRIISLLAPRVDGPTIEKLFAQYEVKNQGQMSRSENRWIFTYNTKLIQPADMLKKFRASDRVLEAEFVPVNEGG